MWREIRKPKTSLETKAAVETFVEILDPIEHARNTPMRSIHSHGGSEDVTAQLELVDKQGGKVKMSKYPRRSRPLCEALYFTSILFLFFTPDSFSACRSVYGQGNCKEDDALNDAWSNRGSFISSPRLAWPPRRPKLFVLLLDVLLHEVSFLSFSFLRHPSSPYIVTLCEFPVGSPVVSPPVLGLFLSPSLVFLRGLLVRPHTQNRRHILRSMS